MKHRTSTSTAVLLIAGMGILAAAGGLFAGPLTPPAGVVSSTGKTITEAEPRIAINATNTPGDADSVFRITQAGGYYLTGNILATTGRNGIEIAASGVTIDLNGFQIGSFGGLAAIVPSTTAIERIVIRDGRINGGTGGIILTSIPGVVVEGVSIESCSGYGIRVGTDASIKDCVALGNTIGMSAGERSIFKDCRSSGNSSTGISMNDFCVVTHCTANDNEGAGITASVGCVISECAASSNTGSGFTATSTSSITKCTAEFNGSSGMYVAWNSTVSDCVTFANGIDGIRVDLACLVKGNTCISNGSDTAGSGIRATSDENRIEGNNCIRNYRGIYVSSAGNIILGNTCSSNESVNWEIAANNKCLVVQGLNAAAISGDSGGTSPGSTSPWTNFTY